MSVQVCQCGCTNFDRRRPTVNAIPLAYVKPTGLLDAPERVRTACENVPWELVEVTVRYPYGRSHHKWVSRRVM